jgi:hypothetical protein
MSKQAIFKLVKILTLAIPLPVFLFLSATLFSIQADYIINANISTVEVIEYNEGYFIYSTDQTASISGLVIYNDGLYGIEITSDDIIKIEKGYYSYLEVDGVYELRDVRRLELQKEQSYKIPLSFFISLIGVLIIVLIVQNKLKWHKDHPKGAVMIALITGTVILYVIQLIVSSVLGVFVVATASWGLYLIEDLVEKNAMTKTQAEKTESEILNALKNALR